MKVYIGPFINFIGPYQIAEKILFWKNKYEDDSVHDFGKWLSVNSKKEDSILARFCQWINNKRKRNIKIHIDNYDVWNLDDTLSMIILPCLKELKKVKHGSGFVDFEDLPEHLKFSNKEDDFSQICFDFYSEAEDRLPIDIHVKYEWLLDELIWTFEQLNSDPDWMDQYVLDRQEIKKTLASGKVRLYEKPIYDWEAVRKHEQRIQNGLVLFGKYFRTLWD